MTEFIASKHPRKYLCDAAEQAVEGMAHTDLKQGKRILLFEVIPQQHVATSICHGFRSPEVDQEFFQDWIGHNGWIDPSMILVLPEF